MFDNRKTTIGVMGSAGGKMEPEIVKQCRELGRVIAERDCIMITGACPGLPHEAVLGAREAGGLIVGISPAMCLYEHVQYYESPHEEYDVIIFTGSGLMGREVAAVRSCDIMTMVGGRSGTLGEFAIAFDEAKLIGTLLGTGGITECVDEIVKMIKKVTGAEVVADSDPAGLVDRCLERHQARIRDGFYCRGPLLDKDQPEPTNPTPG